MTGKYQKVEGPLNIEPIGFMIIIFLSLILVIQTIGMVAHRWQTLQHTLASTVLPCFKKTRPREYNGEELLEENAVEIGKHYSIQNFMSITFFSFSKTTTTTGRRRQHRKTTRPAERWHRSRNFESETPSGRFQSGTRSETETENARSTRDVSKTFLQFQPG